MIIRAPYLEPTDFDYDEGINLMKSLLFNRGHSLYSEIWSDQPPFFTIMLSGWLSIVGQTVAAARWLMILLSTLLLWSFYQIAQHTTSTISATIAVILLVTSEYYLRLSGAVMIGLPSVALVMISVAILLIGNGRGWEIPLSALLMALAIQTKLMAGLAIPGLLVYLIIIANEKADLPLTTRYRSVAIWLSTFVLIFLSVGLFFQSMEIDQLLTSHFGTRTRNHEPFIAASATFLPNFWRQHLPAIIAGFFGLCWTVWHARKEAVIPITWLGVALVGLSIHRPLWYHHVLYLTVPLVLLAAYGFEAWRQAVLQTRPRDLTTHGKGRLAIFLLIALIFVVSFWQYPAALPQRLADQMTFGRPVANRSIVEKLVAESAAIDDESAWLLTDRPYYAFVAGRPVPPELAVFSRKRLSTGQLTTEQLVEVVIKYQPEAILLERFANEVGPDLGPILEKNYELVQVAPPVLYYRKQGF